MITKLKRRYYCHTYRYRFFKLHEMINTSDASPLEYCRYALSILKDFDFPELSVGDYRQYDVNSKLKDSMVLLHMIKDAAENYGISGSVRFNLNKINTEHYLTNASEWLWRPTTENDITLKIYNELLCFEFSRIIYRETNRKPDIVYIERTLRPLIDGYLSFIFIIESLYFKECK